MLHKRKGVYTMDNGFRIWDIPVTAANAVVPIILLILLGYFLKRKNFLSEDFLRIGNKLVFQVCLPAMLFINVYDIADFRDISWDVVIYSVLALVVLFFVGLAAAIFATRQPERRGVVLQCVFRSNYALIGLSLVSALGGQEAAAIAAVLSAFTIPVFNILGVIALTMFVNKSVSFGKTCKQILSGILKNPLILAIGAGLICLGLRGAQNAIWGQTVFSLQRDLKFLYSALSSLKAVASPFALMVLGGQFAFDAVKSLRREIITATFCRLVITPLLGIGGAVVLSKAGILSCGPEVYPSLIALFGSPVAVSSAIMAGSMGNDKQLAAQLVVWTSLFSIVTIFLTVCILMGMGLLVV